MSKLTSNWMKMWAKFAQEELKMCEDGSVTAFPNLLAEGNETRETTMARPNRRETPVKEKGTWRCGHHFGDDIPLEQFDSADFEYANEIFGRRILDEISQGQNPGWMGGCWQSARSNASDEAMVDPMYEENGYRPIRYRWIRFWSPNFAPTSGWWDIDSNESMNLFWTRDSRELLLCRWASRWTWIALVICRYTK